MLLSKSGVTFKVVHEFYMKYDIFVRYVVNPDLYIVQVNPVMILILIL